jgi:hypothetical protein
LEIEELQPVAAPGINMANHNETVASDEVVALEIEELEEIVAPGYKFNHNETSVP